MKNPDRVAQLLAELRELADNDFERHRLDILERDLAAPPQVEVIDDKHLRFNGITYYQNGDGHFHSSPTIHRIVWNYYRGEIPKGYVVHHRNFDKSDNTIENLQVLSNSEHRRLHNEANTKEFICLHCGQKFISIDNGMTKYCSVFCREEHYKETAVTEMHCQLLRNRTLRMLR